MHLFSYLSEAAIETAFFESQAFQEKLQENLEATAHHFRSLRDQHLSNERNLKLKANKLESQLNRLVSTYDIDLMDKKEQFEEQLRT